MLGGMETGERCMAATLTGDDDEQHEKGTAHGGLPPSLHVGAMGMNPRGRAQRNATVYFWLGVLCSILMLWTVDSRAP